MAMWRLNRKNFERRQRMMLLTKANDRFRALKFKLFSILKCDFKNLVEKCELLNEDLSESQTSPIMLVPTMNIVLLFHQPNNQKSILTIVRFQVSHLKLSDEPYLFENDQSSYVS